MNEDFINKYLEETQEIVRDIDREEISKTIKILFEAWKNNKKIITVGNGGSASTASHFAGDLLKTVVNDSSMKDIREARGFKAICLNDNQPALTAWINDSGWEKAYAGLLHTLIEEGDVLLLVSVHGGSGWSNNLVQAIELAKKRKAVTIGLAGFDGGKMKELCDSCIVVPKNSTYHTEGFHGVLQHLIILRVKELIEKEIKKQDQNKIMLFADTANYEEINSCFSKGVKDGITTNPKIMENYGISNFMNACECMLIKYPQVPISLETDLNGLDVYQLEGNPERVMHILMKQAHALAILGDNLVVKIPISSGGLMAVAKLTSQGIPTNVTACMTPYQALMAVSAGATYVSLFSNRMVDCHIIELAGHNLHDALKSPLWKEIVKNNKDKYFEEAWNMTQKQIAYTAKKCEELGSKLIVGSIRSPEDITRIAKAKPQIITIPSSIVEKLESIPDIKNMARDIASDNLPKELLGNSISHPMTLYTLEEFEKAAYSYRRMEQKLHEPAGI